MAIFDVIKYEGPNNIFVWKHPAEDFNTLSQLIVHESQEAILFKDGVALDLFGPGRYTLHTKNIPLLSKLVNLPFGGESPFHCQVYFISKAISMDSRWGTKNPIPVQDAVYNIILPIGANGQFAVRVSDARQLVTSIVGSVSKFDQDTLLNYFRGFLLTYIKDHVAKQFVEQRITFLEVTAKLKELSEGLFLSLGSEFQNYGLELVNFYVNGIVVPEQDPSYLQLKYALSKKAEMGILGYDYQQERTFDVLERAAGNEASAGQVMGAGLGLGMGANLGAIIGQALGTSAVTIEPRPEHANKICSNCKAEIKHDAKFCSNCGSSTEKVCPNCHSSVNPNAKFCVECGEKLLQL